MSKMDDLRAMREARYARATAGSTKPPASPRRAVRSAPKQVADIPAAVPEAVEEQLCGHRNMSGRTCTREAGHAAKSHRYS